MPHQIYKNSNGEKLPSVTTVLSVIAKPALIAWSNKKGLEGINYFDELKRTAKIGSLVHAIAEYYTSKTPIEWDKYTKEEIKRACTISKRFFEFVSLQDEFKPILSEGAFASEKYGYGGCLDLICSLNGKITLLDYKTSSNIYDEMVSQVAAYKRLAEEQGYKIEQVIILRFGREESEGYEYREISKKELKYGLKMFDCALKLYKSKKEFERVLKESEVK